MNKESDYRIAMLKIEGEYALDFGSAVYGDILSRLVPEVQSGDWHSNPLILPFTFTCAAALEARLNDHLVAHAFSTYSAQDYRRHAEAFLSMNLRGKLDTLVPLLSNNRFVLRTDSNAYKSLARLISLRNDLVHSKSFFEKVVSWDEDGENLQIDKEIQDKMRKRRMRSVDSAQCNAFYSALKSLDEDFLYPNENRALSSNLLITELR